MRQTTGGQTHWQCMHLSSRLERCTVTERFARPERHAELELEGNSNKAASRINTGHVLKAGILGPKDIVVLDA